MSEIKVTFAALDTAQQGIASTAGRINMQLEDLKRFLAPMAATWQGEAAEDYRAKQRKWDAASADLAAVLRQIGVALGTANEGYQQVEQANAARWR
jgi:early secretory antigenic target protein ESAT-6